MSTFTRTIRTNPDEAHALREDSLLFFREQQEKGMATRVDEYFFRLAVDETLSNAMHHGNGNDGNKKIHVHIEFNRTGIVLYVKDEGNGFDPAGLPDPRSKDCVFKCNGRGVFILSNIGSISWDEELHGVRVVLP